MITATELGGRDGTWQSHPGFGIYVHIPFCLHRCHYCDFNTYEGLETLRAPYVDAVIADIERDERVGRSVTSVFFGGGTPTLLTPHQLARILEAIGARFGIATDAEITAEANPETVDVAYLRELVHAGFNRLSVGVQSLSPGVLQRLGRTHSSERAVQALRAAREAAFDDVNADLIYGSPWERPDDWVMSLRGVIDAGPDHVSAYALTVEEGTPLHTLVASGRVPDVDPDTQAERHRIASDILAAAGYERYEVSNWSRPHRASRHNVLYWSAGDYVGFGAGAHSHVAGRRWWSLRLPRDYVAASAAGTSTVAGSEELSADQRAGEALMLGLRLTSGVERAAFVERFGPWSLRAREEDIASLVKEGLVEASGGRIRVTTYGTLLGNEVAARLL
ncbi:MAG: radical SAM family heme chaperone HemW [Actinobacteria bacterium]|nr:radical SAM family heme chaperone HemW [Actinomycetota bacterium]